VTPGTNEEPFIHRCRRWLQDHPRLTLVLAVLLCLGPFLGKPVHLDDPVYIWIARHILSHPWDPYGFAINWGETVQPVSEFMQNPPLACYYLALAGGLCGWSEIALHTAFLLPAIAVVLGTYELARRLCAQPGLAALATLVTPVFLVSGTTLMCDMLMLAFWMWAVVLWDRGLEQDNPWWLAGAGVLMSLAEVTKYFGVCVLPLLMLYAWLRQRRAGWWLVCGLIPVAVLLVYQWTTKQIYGHGLFASAGRFSLGTVNESHLPFTPASVALLGFTGGCLAWPLFMTPLLWRRSHWITAAGMAAVGAVLFHYAMGCDFARRSQAAPAAWGGLQMAAWSLGGATLVGLAVSNVRRERTPEAWLLLCWVAGTMVFAGFVNWTLNGRSILPLAPAADRKSVV